ncbi:MAG: AI-2E family transporter [Candidatus Microsaccharimonas sp.]
MSNKIDIDTRTFVRFWLVVFGIGLAGFLLYNARVALIILGVSIFLALALNGPVSRIAKRLPGRSRVGATAIAYVIVVALLSSVILLLIPPIVQQTAGFIQGAPALVDSASKEWDGLGDLVDQYNLQPQVDAAVESIKNSAAGWASSAGQGVVNGIGSIFSFVAALILVLVLTFLTLIEGPEWMNRIWRLYRDKSKMEKHRRVAGKMYTVVTGYVTGQLTVSTIGATVAGLAVFIMSFIFPEVEAGLAIPTATITFLLSLIPMFGATIGGVIITLLLALNSVPAAIVYIIFFVVYQQIENNFISPHIQSKKINLSALMILGSVTIGLYMFGIVGGIIAIPIAGSIRILIDEYLSTRSHTKPSDTPDIEIKPTPKVKLAKTTKD